MANTLEFPLDSCLTVDGAIARVANMEVENLICIGYAEGEFFMFSSRLSKQDAVWLAVKLQQWVMDN